MKQQSGVSVSKRPRVTLFASLISTSPYSAHFDFLGIPCPSLSVPFRGKTGPALGGTEYRLMPSACRLIVRAYQVLQEPS